MGISEEAGELWSAIYKHVFYGQPLDSTNIREEIGDLMWYIALVANATGFDLEKTMKENIDKLKERYPESFTEKAAAERRDKWAQWRHTCPTCTEVSLLVVGATLLVTGERIIPNSPLHPDGFEVKDAEVPSRVPPEMNDCSTTDEVVMCTNCGARFPLADLALSKE